MMSPYYLQDGNPVPIYGKAFNQSPHCAHNCTSWYFDTKVAKAEGAKKLPFKR